MCRRRHVAHNYTLCGHIIQQAETIVVCYSRYCKFSPSHPSECLSPQCTRTCAQYRGWPEQYSLRIDTLCPNCLADYTHSKDLYRV
ncbi:hypothetical protein E4T56_gene12851 [Termitomyces sp. T112]|nr:hypothetical protein E4T56_gene12851 [Termitomyces sp. T112]